MQWARLAGGVLHPLRSGAWYPVLSVNRDEIVIAVHQKSIGVPRARLELVDARPERWTLVTREWGAPYLVCPNCAERVPFAAPAERMGCPRCDGWFAVDVGGGLLESLRGNRPAPSISADEVEPGAAESGAINILLVEDEENDAALTIRALEQARVQNLIWTVHDGAEALAFLRREAPHEEVPKADLVLLDLNLPRLDGRDVLLRLREDAVLRRTPVIVLTASEQEHERLATLTADGFLTKPVDFERLGRALRSIPNLGWAIVKLNP
ncbi:MAG TPA: response regulator [Gemmatimonadales bacterium]|nr:response regulator [Gemmatimonadales bacterium]